ncbi:methyltransferase domain-containing protein [Nonomuraea sp. K274]|uniref:Protein-L-isoaspartate O-methyltransferase n=2 Tax=Nonomuraea cypriaca TaxID=1187855 RepID=A0A931AE43_9ACTN|nr:methyltransferase domain-containing protein [Nonomuraea cypriaca]
MDRLIADLDPAGDIRDVVKQAVRAVPRHLFIPDVGLVSPRKTGTAFLIDRDAGPALWGDTVYSDTTVVTQLDDGGTDLSEMAGDYTSSASAPSTVADLLNLLDPDPGHGVLEVGTGTGWTAALLSRLVGEHGEVTSMEVDAAVAEQAAKNLAAAGVHPHLVVGDGAAGCSRRAPFDRVHVTCGIRTVPYAWVAQSRPGAVIVLPYCPGFGTNHALRLVVMPDGTAVGRFPGFASYMMMRSQRGTPDRPPRGPDDKHHLTTRVDPRTIAYAPAGADLAISALTGLTSNGSAEPDEDGDLYRLWVSDPGDPYSWAAVDWRPGTVDYKLYQVGTRPLWDEVVDAYFRWVSWGEPGRDRFGMTVTPEGQRIWLDFPDRIVE